MPCRASTIAFILEQAAAADVTARMMFGEFAIYSGGKLVALVCDDQLFVKPTEAGRAFVGEVTEAPPYPGAKPSLLIEAERWEDGEWLSELMKITASELPEPKPRRTGGKSAAAGETGRG